MIFGSGLDSTKKAAVSNSFSKFYLDSAPASAYNKNEFQILFLRRSMRAAFRSAFSFRYRKNKNKHLFLLPAWG